MPQFRSILSPLVPWRSVAGLLVMVTLVTVSGWIAQTHLTERQERLHLALRIADRQPLLAGQMLLLAQQLAAMAETGAGVRTGAAEPGAETVTDPRGPLRAALSSAITEMQTAHQALTGERPTPGIARLVDLAPDPAQSIALAAELERFLAAGRTVLALPDRDLSPRHQEIQFLATSGTERLPALLEALSHAYDNAHQHLKSQSKIIGIVLPATALLAVLLAAVLLLVHRLHIPGMTGERTQVPVVAPSQPHSAGQASSSEMPTVALTEATVDGRMAEVVERLRDYASSASDWFWEMDANLRFSYFSDRFFEATGVDPADALGKTRWDMAGATLSDPIWQAHCDDLTNRRPLRYFTYTCYRKDGTPRVLRISGKPVFDALGTFKGYRGIGSDVTVFARTQRALEDSERRFRDLIEGSIQGVCLHRNFKPLFANEAFCRMMGYSDINELLDEPSILPLMAPENQAKAAERYRRLLAGSPVPPLLRQRTLRRDEKEIWIDMVERVVVWEDEPAVQLSVMDVSSQVKNERDLEQQAAQMAAMAEEIDAARERAEMSRQAAEAANAAKSRFLAMMSHELRTPMTGIMGMVDLLLGSPLSSEQAQQVCTLKRSAEILLVLLNDILDFSKIEAGQLTLETIDFAPVRQVQEVFQLFASRASEKGVQLESALAADLPPAVRGDPVRLRQVLSNLVSNAIKFTEQGRILVRAQRRAESDDRLTLLFEVEDSGIGLSQEQQGRLFQAFTQADVSTTRRFGGTGLGLAICKRLVEAMGGTIGVRSAMGVGSTFWFTVCVAPGQVERLEEVAAPALPLADDSARSSSSVLLAEDNDINRAVIITMLQRMGHRVEGVVNGRLALEAAAGNDYDVILMDMQMPEMDGADAAEAIRRLAGPRGRVPIIGLTADALLEHRAGYMAAGLSDFLTKPVDWIRLDHAIRRHTANPVSVVLAVPAVSVVPPADSEPSVAPRLTETVVEPVPDRLIPAPDPTFFLFPDPAPVTETGRPALVNIILLDELRQELGDNDLRDMLSRLPPEIDRCLNDIASALTATDLRATKRAAHRVRGMAGMLGAPRLEALGRAIEEEAPSLEAAITLVEELRQAVTDTLAMLEQRYGPLSL